MHRNVLIRIPSLRTKRSNRGFILLAVLVFLQVFSLMSIYALFRVSDSMKHSVLFFKHHLARMQAQKMLHNLEQRVSIDVAVCSISITKPVDMAEKTKLWWESNGCSINAYQSSFYYVIEWLEDDPCGLMGKDGNGQLLMSRYYRLTLFMPVSTVKDAKLLLQSTMALPTVVNSECLTQKYHTVIAGRQMWREIG